MNGFKRGDVVRVLAATGLGKTDADAKALIGKTGTVTGRTLGEFIEVNIAGAMTERMFGYLLLPTEVEKI